MDLALLKCSTVAMVAMATAVKVTATDHAPDHTARSDSDLQLSS